MAEQVVLVDDQGKPIGTAAKRTVHHSHTPLHLAFSCYVFNKNGELLVTRRAENKKVWPGVWTNSVCGHPAPNERMVAAIKRRLDHELGMKARNFEAILPKYRYTTPPFYGIIENEFCPVYFARTSDEPNPNPKEVADFRWTTWDRFVEATAADSNEEYSWWCKDQIKQLKNHPLLLQYTRP